MSSTQEPPISVCFVCLGNICRSPSAEAVFASRVQARGLAHRFTIDSAGTSSAHVGERPDPRATRAASGRGYAMQSRAREVRADDFDSFDFILAMDVNNLTDLKRLQTLAKHPRAQISLLRDFDPASPPGAEVPDPYYGGKHGFERVLDLCEAACDGFLEHVLASS